MRRAALDLRPLRRPGSYRRLWLGTTASAFGGQFGSFAVLYEVWDRGHSAALLGLLALATAAPLLGFALIGSAFIDRVDRVRLVRVTTVGQLATALVLGYVSTRDSDSFWPLLGLAAVGAAFAAVGVPAQRAIVPRLLPTDLLAAGLALNHLSFQLALLVGPVLAGLVTARWGTTVCFAVDAVTFLAALAGLSRVEAGHGAVGSGHGAVGSGHGAAQRAGSGRRDKGVRAVWAGLRFAAGTPSVRGALLADLAATALAMPMAVFPVLNAERFGGSPRTLGLLLTAVAVGGVLASVLSGVVTRGRHPGRVLLACGAGWGAAVAGVGLAGTLPVVLVLLAVAGGADTWAVVSRSTVVQFATPDAYRGRLSALEHVVGAAGPQLGGVRAGLVAAASSGATAILVGGLCGLAATGLIAARTPALRALSVGQDGRRPGTAAPAPAP